MDSRFITDQVREAFAYHAPRSHPNGGERVLMHRGAESPYIEVIETGLQVHIPGSASYSETRSTLLAALRTVRMTGVPITEVTVPTVVFEGGIERLVKGNLIVDADFKAETVNYSTQPLELRRSA